MDIQDEVYLKAKQRLKEKELTEDAYLKLSKKEKDLYQLSLRVDRDLVNSFESAYQRGYEEGVALGTAQKLLDALVDIPTISSITGVSIEKIEALKTQS